jgi:hypothetical protein
MSGKNRAAYQTLPPPPYLIIPFLQAAVGDLRFAAAIYTNHINILSYRYRFNQWITL